jgi:p-cumate 2,3-dioxygenase alpha subunit
MDTLEGSRPGGEAGVRAGRAPGVAGRAIREDRTLGRFQVDRRVVTDDTVLALERERIFGRCWLYCAHVSELPVPGSFVTRNVAGRELLITRDGEGRLRAFYNMCTHRGAMVCRERSGKSRAFACSYHAWSFDIAGRLIGMPGRDGLPPDATEGGRLDLRPVERLEAFHGFVFVCFDARVEPLVDYLAEAGDYLGYVADQGPQGMEIIGGAQEYSANANWKMLQENSADGYHGLPTHATYFEYLRARDGAQRNIVMGSVGWVKNLGRGHAVGESIGEMLWGRPYARWVPGWGEDCKPEVEAIARDTYARLGQARGDIVVRGDRNLLIFPNLVVNDIMAVTVRTFQPVAPGRMLINSWMLAPVGESAASRDRRLRNFSEFLGPAGFATPDDVEMLETAQRAFGAQADPGFNDCSRGMLSDKPSKTEELQLRTFWRRWSQLMNEAGLEELSGP